MAKLRQIGKSWIDQGYYWRTEVDEETGIAYTFAPFGDEEETVNHVGRFHSGYYCVKGFYSCACSGVLD